MGAAAVRRFRVLRSRELDVHRESGSRGALIDLPPGAPDDRPNPALLKVLAERALREGMAQVVARPVAVEREVAPSAGGLCPVFASIELVGTKWRLLIIHHLLTGAKRYTELLRLNPGLSSKTLTSTLKSLEGFGLVDRHVIPTRPLSVVYSLTADGEALAPAVAELRRWGEQRVLPRVSSGDPRVGERFRGPNVQ